MKDFVISARPSNPEVMKDLMYCPEALTMGSMTSYIESGVTDDVGKQYSINIRFYSFIQHNYWRSDLPKWSCDAYLYLKTSDLAREDCEYGVAWVTFECNSIESVEQFAEKMFKNLNGCYYERWNER